MKIRKLALATTVALVAVTASLATARTGIRCGCLPPPGRRPPPAPKQAISICKPLKLPHHRGWVVVYYGYYTTSCRTARQVVAAFWPRHRQIHGHVGSWRCTRYPYWRTVDCFGPRRQYASGSWSPQSWPHP